MRISLERAAEFMHGKCVNCKECEIVSVTTDTRQIEKGSLFVALKGEKFDGHDFAKKAVENGAVAVVSEKSAADLGENLPVIEVESTYKALLDLAKGYRDSLDISVVGVTGSVGKTTTKDMIAAVLSRGFKTSKTQGNFNNHIGVPKTIFDLDETFKAAVVEMGMNHFGEISNLSKTARPSLSVITCIGVSHIENLGSREGILKAKLEILDGMENDAPIILNADSDLLSEIENLGEHPIIKTSASGKDADIIAKNIVGSAEGTRFDVYVGGEFFVNIFLSAIGIHNVENALLAVAVGVWFGLSEAQIAAGLAAYSPSGMRQRIVEKCGITFIEDCYNASPTSMIASLSVLSSISEGRRAVAVLGDMLELGDITKSAHTEVGEAAGEKCDEVIACGNFAKGIYDAVLTKECKAQYFETNEKAAQYLVKTLKKGDCVLFKASHSMHFEEIISAVYAALEK